MSKKFIDIVFDGPPDHIAPRFIEVEDGDGKSISFGRWVKREDGYYALRIVASVNGRGPHMHCAGTTVGKDIDECATCGEDIRSDIHSRHWGISQ